MTFICCPPESQHGRPRQAHRTPRADVEHQWFRAVLARHNAITTRASAPSVAIALAERSAS